MMMKVIQAPLSGVLVIEPDVFSDDRGFFLETFSVRRYAEAGIDLTFTQDNWSRSVRNTLRGLHFQEPNPQGKLIMATRGRIWDVAVDIRRGSANFGKWFAEELSDDNRRQLWVPPGFAHGFCVLSDIADVVYKCTAPYAPQSDRCLAWNDPDLAISWPVSEPRLSPKDAAAPRLNAAPLLPVLG